MNVDDFLAHYGTKGMKWGVINEERDKEINRPRGKVEEAAGKIATAFGSKKEKQRQAEKSAADAGIKTAENRYDYFRHIMDWEGLSAEVKEHDAEEYLWDIRGNLNINNMEGYKNGDPEATQKLYDAAKSVDILMSQYAEKKGTTPEDNETIKAMTEDSQRLDDLYNQLKENGVQHPEDDPKYDKELTEAENKLDKYAEDVAKTLGIPDDDKEAFKRIKEDFKVLWFNTGYTNIAGHDNGDWSQYGRRDERREQRRVEEINSRESQNDSQGEKEKKPWWKFWHDDMDIELPYLEHHGIKGQKWGVRRFQNYDGTLIKKAGKKEKPEYTSETKSYRLNETRHLNEEELRKRTARLRAENEYREALKRNIEADMSPRRRRIQKIFVDSAENAASEVMKQIYTKSATAFIKDRFPMLMGGDQNGNRNGNQPRNRN